MRIIILSMTILTLFVAQDIRKNEELTKKKQEIINLKANLTKFYDKKEEQYKKQQLKLVNLVNLIKTQKLELQELYQKNRDILKSIKHEIDNKTSIIYNSMKPKQSSKIFETMITDGKIDEVFQILITLKDKKVTQLMGLLKPDSAALLTKMLLKYKIKN